MRFSVLADWLRWLEQSHPKEIDLGLARIHQVAARLALLTPKAKVVTVAGTNGKGSCVTATAGLLRAASFSVGVYTSPHLLHYAERIQINGTPVVDELICAAFEKIADAAAEISLTYFEYGTLAALLIFIEQDVDFIVLEVGLGGRLDAVNIIDADVAVITSIAIDHQDWLGDNREMIGREKAGILRESQRFVCADEEPPRSIVDLSQALHTDAYFIGQHFSYAVDQQCWQWQGKTGKGSSVQLPKMARPHLPLPSLAAALQVVHLLDISLSCTQIEAALLSLVLPGRFQKIQYDEREFVLDVAHNPAATKYFAERLRSDSASGKTIAIVAMMADKDRDESLANLVDVVDEWYLLELSNNPRAATTDAMAIALAHSNTVIKGRGDIEFIMRDLLNNSNAQDRVLVFGSFFTVAAALTYLQTHS